MSDDDKLNRRDFIATTAVATSALAAGTSVAAINPFSTVVLIQPEGSQQTVLTAADGLSNPSSLAVRGGTVYLLSAAYLTQADPNIMVANLNHQALSAPPSPSCERLEEQPV